MHFSIELKPDEGESLIETLKRCILQDQIEFAPYLLRLITVDQTPLTFVENSMILRGLTLDGECLSIEGTFQSNYFAACRNQESNDVHSFTMSLQYRDHTIIFEGELPLLWDVEN